VKSIRFNTRQIKATLDGLMTEVRIPIKLPKWVTVVDKELGKFHFATGKNGDGDSGIVGPDELISYLNLAPYQPGDILYVRETWANTWTPDGIMGFVYKVDGKPDDFPYWGNESTCKHCVWRPSIHMPKEAARLFLKVAEVRVERVQDITEESALAEGVDWLDDACYCNNGWSPTFNDPDSGGSPVLKNGFSAIWDSVYKNWSENPWVWVIMFEKVANPND
jgi:hypothetical protein